MALHHNEAWRHLAAFPAIWNYHSERIRHSYLKCLYLTCAWAYGVLQALCVYVCVCVQILKELHDKSDSGWVPDTCRQIHVSATTSDVAQTTPYRITPVVGVSLFGTLVKSPQMIDTLSV